MHREPIWVFRYDPQRFLWLCGNVHGELHNVCDEAIDAYFEARKPMPIGDSVHRRFPIYKYGGVTRKWPVSTETMNYVGVTLERWVFYDWHITFWCKFVPEIPAWVWQGKEYVKQLDPIKCKEYLDAKAQLDERTHTTGPQTD